MAKAEYGRIGQNRYYGTAGNASIFFEEFLSELRGVKGAHAYTEMADNDATVGAILFAIEMLMRQCTFHVEPAGDTEKDKEAAEFVESCMDDMERTWADTLSEILSFLTYGWSYHEIVYKRRVGRTSSPITNSKHEDGLIGWRKLPIRSQDTLYGWEYKEDSDDLVGMVQSPPPNYGQILIPIEKALHFRTRSRKDNPEGRSILRTAYRAYYFKKRLEEIEGYGMERDLAGFPVLYAPADMPIWDKDDPDMVSALARAEHIVSSIRRDAREGLVIPGGENGWKLELLSSGSRRQFDTNQIIDRYDKRIATSVLADFVMMGQQQVGSFALADSKTKIFALAIGTFLDIVCEVFNNQAIPRLIDINGDHFKGITDYPYMEHGDIEEKDLTQFASFIESMVGAGVIVPDEALEDEVRRVGGLPEKIETDAPREVQPGENDPQAGADGDTAQLNDAESKSIYKITSLLEKYKRGTITRNVAESLFEGLGIDGETSKFYLDEADKAKDLDEKATQEAAGAPKNGKKAKQEEMDVEDAKEAEKAKKSLGRSVK
jgi:phage gp29-like protein